LYRAIIVILAFFFLLFAGCGDRYKTKEDLLNKGVKFMNVGDPGNAVVLFKKALEKDQNFFDARLKLAEAYLVLGKLDSAEKELQKVVRQNPGSKDVHVQFGRFYLQKMKPDEAIREVAQYIDDKHPDEDAAEVAGMAYAMKGDYTTSITMLKKILSNDSKRSTAALILAKVYMMAGKSEEAKAQILEVLKKDPTEKRALFILAEIQTKGNDRDGAIKTYERILKSDPRDIRAFIGKVSLYIGKGDYDQSLSDSDKFIRDFPKRPEGYRLKGVVLYYKKSFSDAIVQLERSVSMQQDAGAFYYLGLCHYYKGEPEQAITSLQSALNLNPSFAQAGILSSVILLGQKRTDDAITEVKKVLEKDEKNASAHDVLGSAYIAKGMYTEGIEELNRAIDTGPKVVNYRLQKGLLELKAGRFKEAEAELNTAVHINPELLQSRVLLASYYQKRNEYDKAIEISRQGIKGQKTDAIFYSLMADVFSSQNKITDAIKYWEKAKQSNPDYDVPYFRLASHFFLGGERERAVNELNSLVQKAPDNAKALIGIASMYESEGDEGRALKYYLRAQATGKSEGYIELSRYYVRKNKSNEALRVLEAAINKYPSEAVLYEIKGDAFLSQKEYGDALKAFEEVEKFKPGFGLASIINTYISMNKPEKALEKINGELRQAPERLDLMAEKSRLYVLMGKKQEAIENAMQIVSRSPKAPIGYMTLAGVYQQDRNTEKAIEVLKRAEGIKDVNLITMLGTLYDQKKEHASALQQFQKAERISPGYIPAIFRCAYDLNEMNRKREAMKEYERILKLSRNHLQTLNNLAYLYAEENINLGEAIQLATRASALAPRDGLILDTLGFVLLKSRKIDEGLKTLRKAAELAPANSSVYYHLALAYKEQGDKARAIENIKKALKMGEFRDAGSARTLLERLEGGARG
jgi:putative PEP-CTERM system TPR-repeat lipoprotein